MTAHTAEVGESRRQGAAIDVSVILVNYNTAHLLGRCLDALRSATRDLSLQVVLVDNASHDGSADVVRRDFPEIQLIESGANVGFGRANNLALARCTGRYILLLNTDAFVEETTVVAAVRRIDKDAGVGIVGVRLIGSDGSQQPSCRYFPTPLNLFLQKTGLDRWSGRVRGVDDLHWNPDLDAECDWVPGCFLMIRRSIVDSIGLFDPRYFLYCEEVDLCRRVKAAGWKVSYLAAVRAVHIGGESAKSEGEISKTGRQLPPLQIESQLLYFRKHHGLAGVALHLVLECVATVALFVKRSMRAQRNAYQPFAELRLTWRLALRTGGGRTPTR